MRKEEILNLEQQISAQITKFQLVEARAGSESVHQREIPLENRWRWAQLARRTGLNRLALKFLHEVIHVHPNPTLDDRFEYATSLRKLGLVHEARKLLTNTPRLDRDLHLAFCSIHEWDMERAERELSQLLIAVDPESREHLLGSINLASVLLNLHECDRAEIILNGLLERKRQLSEILSFNVRELQGQLLYRQKRSSQAGVVLDDLIREHAEPTSSAVLFVHKWKVLSEIQEGRNRPEEIEKFRFRCRELRHWESLRHFTFEQARLTQDENLLAHVYFGTPFDGFKTLMSRQFPSGVLDRWLVRRDTRSSNESPAIDPYIGKELELPYGLFLHRLFMTLLSDVYQPWDTHRLFDVLCPDEVFNPFISSKKIHHQVQRLREHLTENQLPVELVTTAEGFRLRPCKGQICVYKQMIFQTSADFLDQVLREKKPSLVTAQSLSEWLPLSVAKSSRLLRALRQQGRLEVVPGSHRYRVA